MTAVGAATSPINYLVLIDCIGLPRDLNAEIVMIPTVVPG
jgi:hypothetical protein